MRRWEWLLLTAGIGFLCVLIGMTLASSAQPQAKAPAMTARVIAMERAFKAANARTEKLERAVDALAERVDRLEPVVAGVYTRATVAQENNGEAHAPFVSLDPRVNDLAERLPKVADAVVGLAEQIRGTRERIGALERTVDGLSFSQNPAGSLSGQGSAAAAPGLAAWRKLSKGMTEANVRGLLGEPKRVNAGWPSDFWFYSDAGMLGPYVSFMDSRVTGWEEPR